MPGPGRDCPIHQRRLHVFAGMSRQTFDDSRRVRDHRLRSLHSQRRSNQQTGAPSLCRVFVRKFGSCLVTRLRYAVTRCLAAWSCILSKSGQSSRKHACLANMSPPVASRYLLRYHSDGLTMSGCSQHFSSSRKLHDLRSVQNCSVGRIHREME